MLGLLKRAVPKIDMFNFSDGINTSKPKLELEKEEVDDLKYQDTSLLQ